MAGNVIKAFGVTGFLLDSPGQGSNMLISPSSHADVTDATPITAGGGGQLSLEFTIRTAARAHFATVIRNAAGAKAFTIQWDNPKGTIELMELRIYVVNSTVTDINGGAQMTSEGLVEDIELTANHRRVVYAFGGGPTYGANSRIEWDINGFINDRPLLKCKTSGSGSNPTANNVSSDFIEGNGNMEWEVPFQVESVA